MAEFGKTAQCQISLCNTYYYTIVKYLVGYTPGDGSIAFVKVAQNNRQGALAQLALQ